MALRLSILVSVLIALAAGARGASAHNALANSGFEDGWQDGWTVSSNVIRESLVEENAASWNNAPWYYHGGGEAVSVAVGNGGGSGRVSQRVPVAAGVRYTASARFRAADNVASHTWGDTTDLQRAELLVREFDSQGNIVGSTRRVRAAERMDDWEELAITFTTHGSSAVVEVMGWAYMLESFYATLGRAIFDDFSLKAAVPSPVSIGSARRCSAGQTVFLQSKTVTASYGDYCYVQEPDLSAGIRVERAAAAGSVVDVIGTVSMVDGEPVIRGAAILQTGVARQPEPLRITTRSAWTLLPIGLLVTCCGRVESSGLPDGAFTISDGGRKALTVLVRDGKPPLHGAWVRVTGALGAALKDGSAGPVLRAVSVNTVQGTEFDLPSILWSTSTRPDGTTQFWDPEPVIRLGPTLLCVAYRPIRSDGKPWYGVGITPPILLHQTLLNAQPELRAMHDHGIAVIGYADCILYYPDMLEHDGIDHSDLHALDTNLVPVTCSGWGPTSQVSCVNNPKWIELQRQVAVTTARAGLDHLMLDIYPYAIAPGYCCHCAHCRTGWAEASRVKFGQPQPMPPAALDFTDPVHRAFFEWRLDCYSSFVKSVQTSVLPLNPDFRILMNQCADTLDFVREALDGALEMPTTELGHLSVGNESTLYMYRLTERANGGKLIAVINDINQVKPAYRYRICLAEAYAGGGSIYAAAPDGTDEIAQISQSYYDFIRSKQHCFAGSESLADVAVLYSWRDHAYIQKKTQGPTVAYGQGTGNYRIAAAVLARMGVPFDCLIAEQGMTAEMLSRYRVIVAPDLRLLDDQDCALLESYVRAGGSLLCTGQFGTLRQSGDAFLSRSSSVLTTWTGLQTGLSSWNARLGDGFISYVAQAYTGDSETTRVPTSAYRAATAHVGLGRQVRLTSATPVESAVRSCRGGIAIHLIRLGEPDPQFGKAVHLDFALPPGAGVESVEVSSPDYAGSGLAAYEVRQDRLHVDISRLESYALVCVRLCR